MAENCRTLCGGAVIVAEKATDALAAANATLERLRRRTIDERVAEFLMVSFTKLMGVEFAKCATEMPLSERNEAVEAFLFDRTYEPLRVRVAIRRPEGYPYDPHTRRFKNVLNPDAPLAITVADQHSLRSKQTVRVGHLPRDLEHECLVGMRRAGDELDAPRMGFNDEDRVVRDEPAECPHLAREEIGRHDRSPMRSQKRAPRHRALAARRNAFGFQDRGDGRSCDPVAEILQGALDAGVASAGILVGHP